MSIQHEIPNSVACSYPPMSNVYRGEAKIFKLLRQIGWGPELMNLGYYPSYFGMGFLFNRLKTLSTAQRRLVQNAITLMGIENGDHVLDIACGRGGSSFMIRHSTPAAVVHAIDLLQENIEIARRIFPQDSRLNYQQGDAQKLSFEDACFDKVLCCEAAFHFPDRGQFLKEVSRVLKPNGRLVVIDFVWRTPNHRAGRTHELGQIVRNVWEWEDMSSECEYRTIAAEAGLRLTRSIDWTAPVTGSIQRLSESAIWLQKRKWGRWTLRRRYPMLLSFTGEDWVQIEREVAAHRFLLDHTFYKAMVFQKSSIAD